MLGYSRGVKGRYPLEGLRRLRSLQRQQWLAALGHVNAELEQQQARAEAARRVREAAEGNLAAHEGALYGWFGEGSVAAVQLQRHAQFRAQLHARLGAALRHQAQVQLQLASLELKRVEVQRQLRTTVTEGQGVDQHRARWEQQRALELERAAEDEPQGGSRARAHRGEGLWPR